MKNEADRINATLTDEARATLRTRIDLDAFLAASNDRGAQWRGWDVSAKADAVVQMLNRLNIDWTQALVEMWIAKYDERWECGQRESDLVIPAAAAILARATDEHATDQQHGDTQGMAQLNRLRINITRGARLCWVRGDLLVASINNPGQVYSVNRAGCSCKNGVVGKAECWHVALFDLLLAMLDTDAETADIEAELSEEDSGNDPDAGPNPIPHAAQAARWVAGQITLAQRLAATAATLDAMRAAQQRTEVAPVADEPRRLGMRLASARKRSAFVASAFYLEAA